MKYNGQIWSPLGIYLLALKAQHLHQMNVSTAFLHEELSEEVYLMQPEGFVESEKENLVP